jgi:hypothetical protein
MTDERAMHGQSDICRWCGLRIWFYINSGWLHSWNASRWCKGAEVGGTKASPR